MFLRKLILWFMRAIVLMLNRMEKMAMLGVDPAGMIDCTGALPGQSSVV